MSNCNHAVSYVVDGEVLTYTATEFTCYHCQIQEKLKAMDESMRLRHVVNAVDKWWELSDRAVWTQADEQLSIAYQEYLHWTWGQETAVNEETKS